MDLTDQPVVLGHLVLPFPDLGQGLFVDALEAHEETVAAGVRHEVEEGQVVEQVHAHRRVPLEREFFGLEGPEELPGPGGVADEVVVDEHDVPGG